VNTGAVTQLGNVRGLSSNNKRCYTNWNASWNADRASQEVQALASYLSRPPIPLGLMAAHHLDQMGVLVMAAKVQLRELRSLSCSRRTAARGMICKRSWPGSRCKEWPLRKPPRQRQGRRVGRKDRTVTIWEFQATTFWV
jgi:hypothetical protein